MYALKDILKSYLNVVKVVFTSYVYVAIIIWFTAKLHSFVYHPDMLPVNEYTFKHVLIHSSLFLMSLLNSLL